MIGIFVLDEKPRVDKSLCLAHSAINEGIKGYFYFRDTDCSDVCSVDKGSSFFGVLDDTSGFGACLFILDLELEKNNLLLQHNLHVKENVGVDGNVDIHKNLTVDNNITCKVNADIKANANVGGKLVVNGTITGKSPNTSILLNPANVALIAAAIASGAPAYLQAVQVDMMN